MMMRLWCVLIALAANATAQLAWERQNPATTPSVRLGHGLAYDLRTGRTVCYGGSWGSLTYRETWVWNGLDWSNLPTAHAPTALVGLGMAYYASRDRVVGHGGFDGSGLITDTWEFDGVDWTKLSPAHTPPFRTEPVMVYHSGLQRVFLFGGATIRNDTWLWDGTDWTELKPTNAPSAREGHAMAYDIVRDRVVLFGGRDITGTLLGDHWEFDGTDWVRIHTQTVPPARMSARMVYDPHRQRIVMHRGMLASAPFEWDTIWEYDGIDWVKRIVPNPVPTISYTTPMVYDVGRRRMVTFGLVTSSTVETWELFATRPATYDRFARGCPQNPCATLEQSSLSLPWLGDRFELQIQGPAGSSLAFLVTGFSNQQWGPHSLPFDLSVIGIPGCSLLVAPHDVTNVALTGGSAQVTVPIPNDPRLVGLHFYQQAIVADPAAAPLPLTLTDGHDGVIGSR